MIANGCEWVEADPGAENMTFSVPEIDDFKGAPPPSVFGDFSTVEF